MSDLLLREAVLRVVRGQTDIALSRVQSALSNAGQEVGGVALSRQLRALGWRRDGWHGVGYDRTPRYVWGASA